MAKRSTAEIRSAILDQVPQDGSGIGNAKLKDLVSERLGIYVAEADYFKARDALVVEGLMAKGRGRGGSVHLVAPAAPALALEPKAAVVSKRATKVAAKARQNAGGTVPAKATRARRPAGGRTPVIAYRHDHKRINNPDVGVVTPETDPEQPRTTWAYDPHIDPALQFDVRRARIEALIDDALASGDQAAMREALGTLKRMAAPYLNWAGKAERTSFEIDTVSLHVHERIDPATILRALHKRMKDGKDAGVSQGDMFRAWFEDPLPYREAIEFYKHDRGWSNRLIAGDSLLVMNSLLHKEGMAGQVQMIYIDPPYGIKYGSNFQPFVNKRDVKDRKDEDLTQEPEMIKAFRDTWELGIHSYLTYLRDRLLLAKDLLHESGSVFVQISDENVHHVRELMDEVFGQENFVAGIAFKTTSAFSSATLSRSADFLVWYGRNARNVKYRQLYADKSISDDKGGRFTRVQEGNGRRRFMNSEERENLEGVVSSVKVYRHDNAFSQGRGAEPQPVEFLGIEFDPWLANSHWKCHYPVGVGRLAKSARVATPTKNSISYVRFIDDFPVTPITNVWSDTQTGAFTDEKSYVVQTNAKVIERCLLMTTEPGDLVLDPTCGSGTTAFVAERWGRRWITCDTSRVAVTLAKQRLMTASYDYFELKYPHEGLRGGFIYKTVPHVTLKSIANNPEIDEIWDDMHPAVESALATLNTRLRKFAPAEPFVVREGGRKGTALRFDRGDELMEWEVPFDQPEDWPDEHVGPAFSLFHGSRQAMQKRMDASIQAHADQETLFDQPDVARDKLRITGPFTVEAVPFPTVLALDETQPPAEADQSIARSGESSRQHAWRDELLKTGIRGKGGQKLAFADLETLPDTRYLHCTGHLGSGERVVVSFGPEHAALEQRQVELAMREAGDLFPRPKLIVFCAFTFDPEAAKDIDATRGITALRVQMNTDLLTEDLKKARSSNQSFWLMGQPDVDLRQRKDGQWEVEVNGFDYFDTTTGELKSGGKKNIAAWALDTDYDERSLFPRQVFFPMAGAKDGWNKLRRDIKAELDESRLDKLHGTVSLPFEPGDQRKVAVKIVDDRGIESLKVLLLD